MKYTHREAGTTDAFFFGDSGSYDEVRGEGADRVEGPVALGGADMGPVNMQHRMRDARARWWSQLMDKFSTFSPAHCTDRRTCRDEYPSFS